MNKPELLAPAGNMEKLKVALHYGADAVYAGLDKLSLRANADNFTRDELVEAVQYTHERGKKLYIAMNIYFTPDQTEQIIEALHFIRVLKPDGLIISDTGLIELSGEICPEIPVHISTQANSTNEYSIRLYEKLGISRVVLARELSVENIRRIRNSGARIEIEAFIHGAMCISYSGRCLLSSYMTTQHLASRDGKNEEPRSANKGDCAHSCRWEFVMKEKSRDNDTFDITEDSQGTYIMSSKDICMIDHLDDLIDAGVNSFKIEGRMKSILYISSIVRAYRQVIDRIIQAEKPYVSDTVRKELDVVSHREFSTGFFYTSPQVNSQTSDTVEYTRNVRLAAMVTGTGAVVPVKVYNKFTQLDKLELIGKNMKTIPVSKVIIRNSFNEVVDAARHTELITLEMYDSSGTPLIPEEFDILRMESNF